MGGALAARVFAGILAGRTRVGDVVARATVLITAGVSGTLVKYLSFDGAGRHCGYEDESGNTVLKNTDAKR